MRAEMETLCLAAGLDPSREEWTSIELLRGPLHLLPTFDLLWTLLGERDEGVMRSYAKRSKGLLQAC